MKGEMLYNRTRICGSEIRTCVPISSSTTSILSAMTGGLLPLLRALSSIWIAFAWNWSEKRGHLNVNDIEAECA